MQSGEAYLPLPQHLVELLQATILTIDHNEFEVRITPTEILLKIHNCLFSLGDAWIMRVSNQQEKTTTDSNIEEAVISGIRTHTFSVRNPGFPSQIFGNLESLCQRIDDKFNDRFPVPLTPLIEMWKNLILRVEKKLNERQELMHSIYHLEDPIEIVSNFLKQKNKSAQELVEALKMCNDEKWTKENACVFCMCQMDLELPTVYAFTIEDFVEFYPHDCTKESLIKIIDLWSITPGELKNKNVEHLFLDNDIWGKPIIGTGGNLYFWPLVELTLSFGLEMIESIISCDTEVKEFYHKTARAEFLENRTTDLFKNKFPEANIYPSAKWVGQDSKDYETDLVVHLDRTIFIVECKSGKLSAPAKRGSVKRLVRNLKDLITDSLEQSQRLSALILNSDQPVKIIDKIGSRAQFSSENIDRVIRLHVTLDYLGPISCALRNLSATGLIDSKTSSAPLMPLVDLEVIFDILQRPSEIVHYFYRRTELERRVEFHADELDFLVFYLSNGFNIGDVEFDEHNHFQIYGISTELEEYFFAKERGEEVDKPSPKYTKWIEGILNYIELRKMDGWVTLGTKFLCIAYQDQIDLENMVWNMLKEIHVRHHEKDHKNTVVLLNGPEERRNILFVFGFRDLTRTEYKRRFSNAFDGVSNDTENDDIVGIALDAEGSSGPYVLCAWTREKKSAAKFSLDDTLDKR
ncbi:hypothetical protein ACWPKO_12295 [Coraliomargarita sp. W4R53]